LDQFPERGISYHINGRSEIMGKKMNEDTEVTRKSKTMVGYLAGYALDDDSSGITFISEDDDEYIVMLDRAGRKLLEHVDQEVILTGLIDEDDQGQYYISVRGFDLMDYDNDYVDDVEGYDDEYGGYDDDFEVYDDDFFQERGNWSG
jgi:hypothetical protein